MKLQGQVAIITGASRGIGHALAVDFAKEGARVVVAARSEETGKLPGTIRETVAEIQQLGGEAIGVRCDVSDEDDVARLVDRTVQQYGKVDVLVNNAAVGYYRPILDTPTKHWDLVFRVNLRGPFLTMKAVLPLMIERRSGNVLNVSSYAADRLFSEIRRPGQPRQTVGSAYGSSKIALERLTRGVAEEVREYNVAVNALKPAQPTWSPGVTSWNEGASDEQFVSPHLYMTKAAIYLASRSADELTGGVFEDRDLVEARGL